MKVPTTLTSTFSLIICTNGVSSTSNPLVISSFRLISPASPKGLFCAKGLVICNSETSERIVSLLIRINSLTCEIFELLKSFFSFIMSLTKPLFLIFYHMASPFKVNASVFFRQFRYLV